jgi:hypothetical protein
MSLSDTVIFGARPWGSVTRRAPEFFLPTIHCCRINEIASQNKQRAHSNAPFVCFVMFPANQFQSEKSIVVRHAMRKDVTTDPQSMPPGTKRHEKPSCSWKIL